MYLLIDNRINACDNRKIENKYWHIGFDPRMIVWRWIYQRLYYYSDRSNGSSIMLWLSENWDFVWRILKILLIVEVNWLLVTCKTVDRPLLSMWAKFSRPAKEVGYWKVWKKYSDLCTKLNVCSKYQGKTR